jgi:TRAP-type C4-dicarboxylate transport system substrate-binding protein
MKTTFTRREAGKAMLGAIASASVIGRANAQSIKLKISHQLVTTDTSHTAMLSLAENLRKSGKFEVDVFPADQLGRQKDVGEMVRQGANVLQSTDPLFLADFEPDCSIMQAPYFLDRWQDMQKLIGSDWLNSLTERLAKKGLRVIAWNGYFGTRQILSKRPIRQLSDLANINFRCAPAPMYVETVKAFGAKPITTGFAEVYTGLSQGTFEVIEAPLQTMWASKFYEQAKFVTLTDHMIAYAPLIVSDSWFKALPSDTQQVLVSEAAAASSLLSRLKSEEEAEIQKKYEAAGITIIRDIDKQPFKKAVLPIYDKYPGWTPGLHAEVQAVLAKS